MLWVTLNMGMSAAHCQGNVREFQSFWRVVILYTVWKWSSVLDTSLELEVVQAVIDAGNLVTSR